MFELQRQLLLTFLAGRGRPSSRPALGAAVFTQMVLFALVSIVVAFSLSAAESAIFRMSRVRAAELAEEGRTGSAVADARSSPTPPHTSPSLAFLRVVAEATCAVFITRGGARPHGQHRLGADGLASSSWPSCRSSSSGSRRAPWAGRTTTRWRCGRAPVAVGLRKVLGPRVAGARRARQRGDPGEGLPRRAVPERGRAARPARHGRGHRGHRGGRAGDDPLGLRARRHRRPRGDGAAHRHGDDQPGQDAAPGHVAVHPLRVLPHPRRRRRQRRRAGPALPQGRRAPDVCRPGGLPAAGRPGHASRCTSCPRASRPTTCSGRCSGSRTTSRWSSTSTAAPPGWSPSRTSSRRSSGRSTTSTTRSLPRSRSWTDGAFRVPAGMSIDDLGRPLRRRHRRGGGRHRRRSPRQGRRPGADPGSHAPVAGLSLTAEKMAGRRHRIATVIVRRLEPPDVDDSEPLARRMLEKEQVHER